MGTGKQFGTLTCSFFVVPGNTFLFEAGLPYLPVEGMFVEYSDVETGTMAKYRVADTILEVEEVGAIPPTPGPPPLPGQP
ncbi:hypothetical protein LCGC14_2407080, partial [marine sediment metagenome]